MNYKSYTPSNTYTDALIELYIKAPTAAGWIAVEVDYPDSSPSDYYIFYIPNTSNWFQLTVHAKPNLGNNVLTSAWGGFGLSPAQFNYGGQAGGAGFLIGTVRVIGRTSGTF